MSRDERMRHVTMSTNDEWMTAPYVLDEMLDTFAPPESRGTTVIWEPFLGDGESANYMRGKGCMVVAEDQDFYEYEATPPNVTMVMTNPPFSDKKRVVRRLCELGVPFVLILPINCLPSLWLRKVREQYSDIGFFIPSRQIHFMRDGEIKKKTPFHCIYLTRFFYTSWGTVWLPPPPAE